MSYFVCRSVHQGHERFSDVSRGKREESFCAALLCQQFFSFLETRCEDIDEVDNGVIFIKENLVGSMVYNLTVVRIKQRQNPRSAFRQHKHFF